jgi:uncharacterized membrane protein YeiH
MLEIIILQILEIIGTVAFAVSGAFVAIKARLDLFGVLFIGCITAVGGGIMRDILIGQTPPVIFSKFYIIIIAACSALIVFVISYIYNQKFDELEKKTEHVNNFFDAIGLAAFSVMGTETAFVQGLSSNVFLAITLGVLTGVGGGVLRDILTSTTPYIFKKHVYAVASLLGASVYYILRVILDGTLIASAVGMLLILAVRMLATKYLWGLPKVHLQD